MSRGYTLSASSSSEPSCWTTTIDSNVIFSWYSCDTTESGTTRRRRNVFPYPFAAVESRNMAPCYRLSRYGSTRKNDLTEHFSIPTGDSMRSSGKTRLLASADRVRRRAQIETTNRQEFETGMDASSKSNSSITTTILWKYTGFTGLPHISLKP
jgi:hypothetical protein